MLPVLMVLVVAGIDLPPDGGQPNRDLAPGPTSFDVHFTGNQLLPDEVYRSMLDLPATTVASDSVARSIEGRLQDFLLKSGFELATVSAAFRPPNRILVNIDEGQLREIFYRGPANLKTLRFELALQLPFDIFNRPALDRQIAELSQELGVGRVYYQVERAQNVGHLGPQVTKLGGLAALAGHEVHPQARYELRIFFVDKEWDTGSRLDVRTSNIDGVEVIGTWQTADTWFTDDRGQASVSGGLGIRRQISDGDFYPTFSRANVESIYYLPERKLRPILDARVELVSRQRPDLGLENYYNIFADVLASGQVEFARAQALVFGAGVRYQDLWGATPWYTGLTQAQLVAPLTPQQLATKGAACPSLLAQMNECVQPSSLLPIRAFRPFVELNLHLLFDDAGVRLDRRSELVVTAHEFLPLNEPQFGEAHASWQRVYAFGWHDLWLKAGAAYLWGDVPFDFEESVNAHLRNVFSDIFVHKLVSESSEFRFSISRDLLKFAFFNDLAVFGAITKRQLDGAQDTEVTAIADCFGPGFNALFEGIIQVNVYYAVGWTTAVNTPVAGVPSPPAFPHFDNGFSLALQKVF